MRDALNGADANFLHRRIDQVQHHCSLMTEKECATLNGAKPSTFSFATGGQMASDAYLMLKTCLAFNQHPQLVVYGVAPRDFVDLGALDPSRSDCYAYLSRFVSTTEIDALAGLSLPELLKRKAARTLYLSEHADELQQLLVSRVESAENHLLSSRAAYTVVDFWLRVKLFPEYKLGAFAPGVHMVYPLSCLEEREPTRELPIYKKVYDYDSRRIKVLQQQCLAMFLKLCRENSIACLVLNMPLTSKNIAYLGDSRYKQYVKEVEGLCKKAGARFVDLEGATDWPDHYFYDAVHLNPIGATKFMRLLIPALGDKQNLVVAQPDNANSDLVASKDANGF
jgi:hypothetical protein